MANEHPDKDAAEAKTEWAEDRTDWAEDRTILANERTFAGWMRTGMAAIAIAVGLKAVFNDADRNGCRRPSPPFSSLPP